MVIVPSGPGKPNCVPETPFTLALPYTHFNNTLYIALLVYHTGVKCSLRGVRRLLAKFANPPLGGPLHLGLLFVGTNEWFKFLRGDAQPAGVLGWDTE